MNKDLNGLVLLVAFGLFCYSLAGSSPRTLVFTAETMLAQAVGATAQVAENPVNSYMKALTEKEKELDEREQRLAYLEERQLSGAEAPEQDPWALMSFGTSIMLFGLVGINFYFDWRRGRFVVANPFSIDLKRRG